MSFVARTIKAIRMFLGGMYQRLLVAAGAVALLVVNWFCQPARRRNLPPQQGQAAQGTLQEALLAENAAEEEVTRGDEGSQESASRDGQLSPPESTRHLRDDAPIAPEHVLIQPLESVQGGKLSTDVSGKSKAGPSARGTREPPAAAPAAPPVALQPEVSAKAGTSNPVDEDYLKSLLDQEFGPPKFAVRKQSTGGPPKPAPPASDERSLQELLDQAFGPPKFAVPKQTSAAPPADTSMEDSATPGQVHQPHQQQGPAAPMEVGEVARHEPPSLRSGVKRQLQEEAEESGFMALTLTVTHGPAAGKVFVADNPAAEYKLGRLPDCSLQLLDQEISGRHASLRWDPVDRQWKLHDVGSLNGTTVAGTPIGREYKVPGPEHGLADEDVVVLGSVSKLSVKLSAAAPAAAAAAVGAAMAAAAKRRHSASQGPDPSGGSLHVRNPSETLSTVSGLQGGLPAPVALQDFPDLGARLCVHNQLGVDHKRMGQGCEDVPYWEMPYEPYSNAGILCVFDGHHGSKAANQATEHVSAVLRAKLLRRDGRTTPPLPPPPPPPKRLAEDDEEEDVVPEDLAEDKEEEQEEEEDGGASGDAVEEAGADAKRTGEKGPQGEGLEGAAGGEVGTQGAAAAAAPSTATAAGSEEAAAPMAEIPPEELLPPPPEGPPLPAFLRGRELPSQQALLKETFLQADQYMSMEEGCTATVVLLEADARQGWTLQSANVGDSSAVLVNFSKGTWCKLSADHRIASSVSERERLAARGHTVRTRLYGLNISRMLGDRFLKEEDLGFLAEPYVGPQVQVEPGDTAVLVVASDGLWDVLPEDRAAKLLLQEAGRSATSSRSGGSATTSQYGTLAAGAAPPPDLGRSGSGAGASSSRPSSATLPLLSLFPSAGNPVAGAEAAGPVADGPAAGVPPLGCQAVADLLLTQALVLRSKDDITVSVLEMGPHLRPGH